MCVLSATGFDSNLPLTAIGSAGEIAESSRATGNAEVLEVQDQLPRTWDSNHRRFGYIFVG